MPLFSTILSASNEQSTATSSTIPTLIQLFHTKSITFDENAKLESHAVLSYQALEVVSSPEGESKLFGQRRKANQIISPNLGVWNCCVTKDKLVDSLLLIPENTRHYCMTVDLSDPSMVEPTLSILHDTLVRLLIEKTPLDNGSDEAIEATATTSLNQLKNTQFGLASKDNPSSLQRPAESDDKTKISLMICALVSSTNKEDYQETQAQNLILYHLRRYAASLNCTLCFVGKTPIAEEVPFFPLEQVTCCWREWVLSEKSIDGLDNCITPYNHQSDLIETVLLRNAQCAGQWDATEDSLWKSLPPLFSGDSNKKIFEKHDEIGDQGWLLQLRDSLGGEQPPATSRPPAPKVPIKEDSAVVSSFFENLLKK
mmetsp:Transcript_7770/g.8586  ORF Transcript_7770/g.8586 Transcript_7770/m.8586 type:complete len:370 (+) Transcript_7770:29-1138(+)